MRKTIYKWFWMWNFDREEKWLNEMAAQGLVLAGVGFARYEFEDCTPGEYHIRLEMLKEPPNRPESQNYVRFLEETGAEHVGTLFRWAYFRKKLDEVPFNLFSDIDSRIQHLNRLLLIPGFLGAANLINVFNWAIRYMNGGDKVDLAVTIVCGIAALLLTYGFVRILSKKLKMLKERRLHE